MFYIVFGLASLIFGVVRVARLHDGFGGALAIFEGATCLVGALIFYLAFVRGPLGRDAIGRQMAVELSDAGMLVTGEGRLPIRYPWHRIARVSQSVAGVVITPRGALDVTYVPARAMADGGDALYAFVAERIVSRRMLIPRPAAFGPALPRSVDGTVTSAGPGTLRSAT